MVSSDCGGWRGGVKSGVVVVVVVVVLLGVEGVGFSGTSFCSEGRFN